MKREVEIESAGCRTKSASGQDEAETSPQAQRQQRQSKGSAELEERIVKPQLPGRGMQKVKLQGGVMRSREEAVRTDLDGIHCDWRVGFWFGLKG